MTTSPSTSTLPEAPLPPGREVLVGQGDSLRELALEAGLSEAEIREVNGLADDEDVVPGMRLFLPATGEPSTKPPSTKPPSTPNSSTKPPSTKPPSTKPPSTPNSQTGTRLMWPVDGIVLRDFAVARGKKAGFDGVLIGAPAGSLVVAADEGRVVFAGTQNTATGNFVIVDHGDLVTVYAHLRRVSVTTGQAVARGDVVGEIGSSGLTGVSPRVEFQVRKKPVGHDDTPAMPIDPLPLLPP